VERFGPYELLRRVAVGGMAEIFVASRSGPGGFAKRVALKRVLPELARQESFREMFADEARLCASLSHPGLVQVFDYGEVEGTPYLAMEWVEGCDLATLLDGGGPLEPEVAAFVIAEVARVLAYVHDARDEDGRALGVVHRDLSPGNVLVSSGGDVKLGDFGVAKARGRLARTDAGRLKGTLAYLSPEQVSGGELDGRTDVYAAGLLLFELLTGERYVQGDSEVELLKAATSPPVRKPSATRKELGDFDEVLSGALAVAADERLPRAALLEKELRVLCGDPTAARDALSARVAACGGCEPPRRHTEMVCAEPEARRDRLGARARRLGRSKALVWATILVLLAGGVTISWLLIRDDAVLPATIAGGPTEPPTPTPPPPTTTADAAATPEPGDASPAAGDTDAAAAMAGATTEGGASHSPSAGDAARRGTTDGSPSTPTAGEDGGAGGGEASHPTSEPDSPAEEMFALIHEAEAARNARGIRAGDDREGDRLLLTAAVHARSGAGRRTVEDAVAAYRAHLERVAIDRAFIHRKMQRATTRIRRSGATPELDRLSQQAARQALSGDYAGANQTLNRIFELTR